MKQIKRRCMERDCVELVVRENVRVAFELECPYASVGRSRASSEKSKEREASTSEGQWDRLIVLRRDRAGWTLLKHSGFIQSGR